MPISQVTMSYTQPNFDQPKFVDLFNVSCVEITNIIKIKWWTLEKSELPWEQKFL